MLFRNIKNKVERFSKSAMLVILIFTSISCSSDNPNPGTDPGDTKPKPMIIDITGIVDAVTWNQPDSTLTFEKVSDGVNAVFTISASTKAKGDAFVEITRDLVAKENIDRLGGATSRLLYLKDRNKKIGFSIPDNAIAKSSDGTIFVQKTLFSGTDLNIFSRTPLNSAEEFTDVVNNEELTWKLTGRTLRKDNKDFVVGKAPLPNP